jgi:hypothetical protein
VSVRSPAAIHQDHVQAVVGRWEIPNQWVVLQLSSKITYFLWVGDGKYTVSGWFCNYPTRSRTSCGQAMGNIESMCASAAIQHDHVHAVVGQWEIQSQCGSATVQQDHVLSVGRRWERQSQCMIRQLFNKITYKLWSGDGRYSVSVRFGNYITKITYRLWAGDGRYSVSGWFCNYPTRSHTVCGQAVGETESMYDSAAIQQDHVQTVVGRWEIPSQWVVLRLFNLITYKL